MKTGPLVTELALGGPVIMTHRVELYNRHTVQSDQHTSRQDAIRITEPTVLKQWRQNTKTAVSKGKISHWWTKVGETVG